MATKRNVLERQLPLIIAAATVVLLTVVWLAYRTCGRSRCDNIFQQTADRIQVKLKFIKTNGELALGQQKIQDLTEASQQVGIHLTTCCNLQQAGALNAEQLQVCMSGAKDYQTQIIRVAANIKEADAAEKQQKPELAKQKTDEAKEGANKLLSTEKTLAKAMETPAASPSAKGGAEQEPNNTIPQANVAEMGPAIAGEISPSDDVDFFKFRYDDAKKRRDIVVVGLKNSSTTLRPSLSRYDEDKSHAQTLTAPNAGAELKFPFSAEPGKIYFVGVASYYKESAGAYALSLKPQIAYDKYEPNDDSFAATSLKLGETIEANIMDGADVDYYKVSGVKEKSLTIDLETLPPPSLKSRIRVLRSDKSIAEGRNSPDPGANLKFSIASEPGQDYFVEVASHYSETAGPYKLTVR